METPSRSQILQKFSKTSEKQTEIDFLEKYHELVSNYQFDAILLHEHMFHSVCKCDFLYR